jgi:ABC-type spermidine/putrescine transport system permease subunit II
MKSADIDVALPPIAPGTAAGGFLAFISPMDNVPVSLFLSNARTGMLPIRMWGMMESTLDVHIAAIAGVLILATPDDRDGPLDRADETHQRMTIGGWP